MEDKKEDEYAYHLDKVEDINITKSTVKLSVELKRHGVYLPSDQLESQWPKTLKMSLKMPNMESAVFNINGRVYDITGSIRHDQPSAGGDYYFTDMSITKFNNLKEHQFKHVTFYLYVIP